MYSHGHPSLRMLKFDLKKALNRKLERHLIITRFGVFQTLLVRISHVHHQQQFDMVSRVRQNFRRLCFRLDLAELSSRF